MGKTYFRLNISDLMFPGAKCNINRQILFPDEVRLMFKKDSNIVVCLDPSHSEIIRVMGLHFGWNVSIPRIAPTMVLEKGDSIIVMSVSNLPPLEGQRKYTHEEAAKVKFSFAFYQIS
ncbi:MAG: hypothetical protein WCT18_01305 [Patescibacteria group bacterium]